MVKLQYTFEARDDLKNIHSFIAAGSSLQAKKFVKALKERAKILKNYPEIGSLVYPGRFKNLRQLLHKSYRIVYHYSPGIITIITIHHQARLPESVSSIRDYTE